MDKLEGKRRARTRAAMGQTTAAPRKQGEGRGTLGGGIRAIRSLIPSVDHQNLSYPNTVSPLLKPNPAMHPDNGENDDTV